MLVAIVARMLSRIVSAITEPPGARPDAHVRRVLILLVLIATLCLLPLRLSPHSARVVSAIVLAIVVLVLLTTAAGFQRLLARFAEGDRLRIGRYEVEVPSLHREVRAFEGVMAVLRRTGLALPALLFFCLWAVVYIFIWAHDPKACPLDPTFPCSERFSAPATTPPLATSSTTRSTWGSPTRRRTWSPTRAPATRRRRSRCCRASA